MLYILSGCLFLLVVRPYEHFQILADIHIERLYLIVALIAFALFPRKKVKMDSILFLYLMFFAALWICTLTGLDPENSYNVVYSYTVQIMAFIMMVFTMHDEQGYIKIIEAMMIITALYVLLSFREFIGGRYEYRMGMIRMLGFDTTFGQSNSFAATIVLSYPLLFVLLKTDFIIKKIRYAFYAYIPLSIFCLFSTGSRGGFIQFIAFALMILWKTKRKFLYITLMVLFFVTIWNIIPTEMQNRYYSLIDPSVAPNPESAHESAEGRIIGFKHGIKVFKENVLFGVGPGNLIYTWGLEHGFQAHNLVGQVLSDTGLLGSIPFFLFIILCYFRGYWLSRTGRRLSRRIRGHPELEQEGRIVEFVGLVGDAIKQMIIVLFLGGLSGHNMLRYNWVYVVYLAVVGSWIMHKYKKMKIEG